MRKTVFELLTVIALIAVVAAPAMAELTAMEQLGKKLYFDSSLSSPPNMACADCHKEISGFTGPNPGINKAGAVYPGAVHQRFGNRKPPTSAYGGESPFFTYDENKGLFVGGMFWDGRATGWVTGDPLADQAMGPFLNPVEQNLPDQKTVCMKVAASKYAGLYEMAFPGMSIDCTEKEGENLISYMNFARAIAAFERSEEISPYTSKWDYVLEGMAVFTPQEAMGRDIFFDVEEGGGKCVLCHMPPEFTDFTYDNLGVPKNPENPFYGMDTVFVEGEAINAEGATWIDPGLAGFLAGLADWPFPIDQATAVSESYGKHKVPTLRNVDKRPGEGFAKAYMHNGVFKSLEEVVKFYDERDAMIAAGTLVPEVSENMNMDELGNLGLSDEEEAALVAFMKTLSDGYVPSKGKVK